MNQGTPRGLPPLPAWAEEAPQPLVPGLLLGRDPFSYRWLLVPVLSPAEGLGQNKRAGSQQGWHRSHSLPLHCTERLGTSGSWHSTDRLSRASKGLSHKTSSILPTALAPAQEELHGQRA